MTKLSASVLTVFALSIGEVVCAQSSNSYATSTGSAAAATHTIEVGKADHKFKPDVTQAEVGDVIEFNFFPPNHSVVRAEYESPCIPYELTVPGKVGFFSGFKPVDAVLSNPPKWSVRINDTDPIFFYCSAPGSCITYGMVGVINPNASTSLETQRTLAQNSTYMLQPGDSFPSEGGPSSRPPASPSSTLTTGPSTSSTAATTGPATSTASSDHGGHGGGLSKGAIAGIAVAGAVVLLLAASLFFYIGRTKTLKEEVNRTSATIRPNAPHSGGPVYSPHASLPPSSAAVMSPKSDGAGGMVDLSGRNSAVVPGYSMYDEGMGAYKPAYPYVNVDEAGSLRSANASPGSDRGPMVGVYGQQMMGQSYPQDRPQHLNPNSPREMDGQDGRFR